MRWITVSSVEVEYSVNLCVARGERLMSACSDGGCRYIRREVYSMNWVNGTVRPGCVWLFGDVRPARGHIILTTLSLIEVSDVFS